MKHIIKQKEPQAFSEWKAQANENWEPSYAELSGSTKQEDKQALMAEQGYICCYCERPLTQNDSHIEHFNPQFALDVNPLDYTNMLCSCQKQLKKGEPRHCGNLKGDWFDEKMLVSPLDPSCEKRFAYMGDGGISPGKEDDQGALQTIENLGLDIPKLRDLRAKAIEPFMNEDLTDEELSSFVSGYLQLSNTGKFGEFYTTILYIFGGLAGA